MNRFYTEIMLLLVLLCNYEISVCMDSKKNIFESTKKDGKKLVKRLFKSSNQNDTSCDQETFHKNESLDAIEQQFIPLIKEARWYRTTDMNLSARSCYNWKIGTLDHDSWKYFTQRDWEYDELQPMLNFRATDKFWRDVMSQHPEVKSYLGKNEVVFRDGKVVSTRYKMSSENMQQYRTITRMGK